jgi:hypothetical protein
MYLTNAVITPSLWQQIAPLLHIVAGYLPVYFAVCLCFPREGQ